MIFGRFKKTEIAEERFFTAVGIAKDLGLDLINDLSRRSTRCHQYQLPFRPSGLMSIYIMQKSTIFEVLFRYVGWVDELNGFYSREIFTTQSLSKSILSNAFSEAIRIEVVEPHKMKRVEVAE